MDRVWLGIDVGSTTVKVAALDAAGDLLTHVYQRANGRPRPTLLGAVDDVLSRLGGPAVAAVGLTGSGGGPIASLLGVRHLNELIAQTFAVGRFHPEARTVIEMGGQDSKLLSLDRDPGTGRVQLVDFSMNALCAAGTGSFLDQQAERLGIAIDREFAELALTSASPARIAGRCTVFAKSDMIHLQQQGTPLPDILAGLCLALARNFKAVIGKGKAFTPPVLFQGGVAYNGAVVRAFEDVLRLDRGAILVPEHHCIMAALGAGYSAIEEAPDGDAAFGGFGPLEEAVRAGVEDSASLPPLRPRPPRFVPLLPARSTAGLPVYLGIDVGSISTCLVLVGEGGELVARRYVMTAGRPLEAVRGALFDLGLEVGGRVEVRGVGTTGSGRYLTGDFVGADVVRNEITAQARAAVSFDPDVETVIEIGGQDSKYIRLNGGAVVDFTMNHACAAGTGSFLEEQADRLRISIEEEFSRLALSAPCPVSLGERCTVFMESDLLHHQQQGKSLENLTGGLAYSIAQNYLNRVVDGRAIGERVLFQGGVAWNDAVVAAFEALLDRPVTVPPNHDVSGAIGAALLAQEELARRRRSDRTEPTRFRGFDLRERTHVAESFECRACPNLCEVSRVTISGEPPIFYGARCDRFEEAGRGRTRHTAELPDLFAERRALLMGDYREPNGRNGRRRVGIPAYMVFHDLFPYWRAFFEELDLEIVISESTNARLTRMSQELAVAETCFPVKLAYGHTKDVLDKDIDFLFLPSLTDREDPLPGQQYNVYCPYVPAVPQMLGAHLAPEAVGVTPLKVTLALGSVPVERTELQTLATRLGVPRKRIVAAAKLGRQAQTEFCEAVRRRGREVLASLPEGQQAVVLVGRPYNIHDAGSCMDLALKFRRLGVLPIPMDYLPLHDVDITDYYNHMFWRCGQDLLAAAKLIAADPRLLAVYVTNFNCGPDSFLTGFFRRIMGRKPFLQLEIDDHTADAGLITRCEAFLESVQGGAA
jgi:predicted CoA-substrate-specific enzyme activase